MELEQVVLALIPAADLPRRKTDLKGRAGARLLSWLMHLFETNGETGQPMVPGSLPTYIVHAGNAPRWQDGPWLGADVVRELFWRALRAISPEDPDEDWYYFFPEEDEEGAATEGAGTLEHNHQVEPAGMLERDPDARIPGGADAGRPRPDRASFDEWFHRVTNRTHVRAQLSELRGLWRRIAADPEYAGGLPTEDWPLE